MTSSSSRLVYVVQPDNKSIATRYGLLDRRQIQLEYLPEMGIQQDDLVELIFVDDDQSGLVRLQGRIERIEKSILHVVFDKYEVPDKLLHPDVSGQADQLPAAPHPRAHNTARLFKYALIVLVVFGLGLVLGRYWSDQQTQISQINRDQGSIVSVDGAASTDAAELSIAASRSSLSVRVTRKDHSGTINTIHVGGVVLSPDVLVMPLAAMKDVVSIELVLEGGSLVPINKVHAVLHQYGVVLARVAGIKGFDSLEITSESAPLYFGSEVVISNAEGTFPGWVDGNIMNAGGALTEVLPVRVQSKASMLGAVIVNDDDDVTGYIVSKLSPMRYAAIDADILREVVGGMQDVDEMEVASLSSVYYESSIEGLLQLAGIELQRRQYQQAYMHYMQAYTLEPESYDRINLQLDLLLASLLEYTKKVPRLNQFEPMYQQVVGQFGENASRYLLMADYHLAKGQYEAAKNAVLVALAYDYRYGVRGQRLYRQVVESQVQQLQKNGQWQIVENVLLSAVEQFPAESWLHEQLGRFYTEQGRYDLAAGYLQTAIELQPSLQPSLSALMRLTTESELAEITTIPFNAAQGSILVEATVNGVASGSFLLDTGATYTSVSPALLAAAGVTVSRNAPKISLSTANGVIRVPLITLDSLSINGETVRDIKVAVVDLEGGRDGLVGLSFLKNFNVRINQEAAIIELSRR